MLKVDETVPRIQELLKTEEEGSAVVVWSDGRITTVEPEEAEEPEEARPPGEDFVVAKFIVREWDLADEEIRDRLNVGLAAGGEWHH